MTTIYDGALHGKADAATVGICNPHWEWARTQKRKVTLPTGAELAIAGPSDSKVIAHSAIPPSYVQQAIVSSAAEPCVKKVIPLSVGSGTATVTNIYEQLNDTERKMVVRNVEIRFPINEIQTVAGSAPLDLVSNGPRPHQGIGYRLIRSIDITNGGCGVTLQSPAVMANYGGGDMLLDMLRSGLPDEHSVERGELERGGFYEGQTADEGNMDPRLRGMCFARRDLWVSIRRLFGQLDMKGADLRSTSFTMTYITNLLELLTWEGAYAGLNETNFATYGVSVLPSVGAPELHITFTNAVPEAARVKDTDAAIPETIVRESWAVGDVSAKSIALPSTSHNISALVVKRLEFMHGDPYGPQRDFNPHLVRVHTNNVGAVVQSFRALLQHSGQNRAETAGDLDDHYRTSRTHAPQTGQNILRLGIAPYMDHGDEDHEHPRLAPALMGVLQSGSGASFSIQPFATSHTGSQTSIFVPPSIFIVMTLRAMKFALTADGWKATALASS